MWLPVAAAIILASSTAVYAAYADNGTESSGVSVPKGMTASYVLYDRETNSVTSELNPTKQYRSASLVKLLIALDYLQTKGSLDAVSATDRAALQSMLRSSDDVAARNFWQAAGRDQVITRMVPRLGLRQTQPPADPNYWGYTALSASDVVKIYRYLLDDDDPQGFKAFVLAQLHQSTRCAVDGRDQSFGIPSAVPTPVGVKQGWSGFGETPAGQECSPTTLAEKAAYGKEAPDGVNPRSAQRKGAPSIDLTSPLLHTSGLVDGDSKILVVLTLYPANTSWDTATGQITDLTRQVYESGSDRASGEPGDVNL
ncbi:MAG: hypothetical protein ACRDQZ_18915 [Mycobacteriales bacterium]